MKVKKGYVEINFRDEFGVKCSCEFDGDVFEISPKTPRTVRDDMIKRYLELHRHDYEGVDYLGPIEG